MCLLMSEKKTTDWHGKSICILLGITSCIRNNVYNNQFPVDRGGASVGFQAVHSIILTYANLCSVLLFSYFFLFLFSSTRDSMHTCR